MADPEEERYWLVEAEVRRRGVSDPLVLAAMGKVKRELFVPELKKAQAYENRPQPIGFGQTISQPYIVAYMIEALRLRGGEKVLEIGSGSGYAAAVLAEIAAEVITIERIEALAEQARRNLARAGYDAVRVILADGTVGLAADAPFDAILVSAGAPEVPRPLCDQLVVGGRLVVPIGRDRRHQRLVRVTRLEGDEFVHDQLEYVSFVPLIGREGWDSEQDQGGDPARDCEP